MHIEYKKLRLRTVWLLVVFAFLCLPLAKAATVTEVNINDYSSDTYEITTAGDYKITGSGQTSKNIKVNVNGTVNITIENVNISTDGSHDASFDITQGTVNLTLSGENTLVTTGNRKAGLRVAEHTSLTITEASNGSSLKAQGHQGYYAQGGAGIGSNNGEIAGAITINGGTIRAEDGDCAAGIGGGFNGSASSITINGGHITAITHNATGNPAAIGGGGNGYGGTILITGGTVIAGGIGAIGHGYGKSTISVTITGGSVSYDSTIRSVTPTNGKGNNLVKKEISGLPANAKITSLVEDTYRCTDTQADASGKAYLWLPESSNPVVGGYSVDGKTYYHQVIAVKKDGNTWNDHNKTFTVKKENTVSAISGTANVFYLENGSYTVYADAETTNQTFTVSGAASQSVTVNYYTVTYNTNGGTSSSMAKVYPAGTNITTDSEFTPIRNYYTFKGWGETNSATEKVETISNINGAKTLYAIWEPVSFTTKSFTSPDATYGTSYEHTFTADELSNDMSNAGGLKGLALKGGNTLPDGLTLSGLKVSGTPSKVDETGKSVTFTATAINGVIKEVTITFKVKKATLTVTSSASITKEYDGNNKVTTANALKLEGIVNIDNVTLATCELTYDNANVGTGKPITIPALSLDGDAKGNYTLAEPSLSLKGAITKKTLTVTPATGQSIYPDEANTYEPAFTSTGTVSGETAAFTGKLEWDSETKVFNLSSLDLEDNGSFKKDNYELKLVGEPGTIEIKAEELSATPSSVPSGENDWYTGDITLKAPDGFKIKANPQVRVAEDWTTSIVISKEGSYDYSYSLLRDGQTTPVEKTFHVQLDKTSPDLTFTTNNLSYTLTFGDGANGSGIAKLLVDGQEVTPEADATTYSNTSTAGSHNASVFDKAGHESKVEFTLKEKEDDTPPYIPPYEPSVETYTVTLPSVEGAATDPVAGEYEVTSWSSFRFYLTLDAAYDQSEPVVTTDRGETIAPRSSDGAYVVKQVRTDVQIFIEGVVKNPDPVANETIAADGIGVWTADGYLYISVTTEVRAAVYNFNGRLLKQARILPGETRWQFPSGAYIVEVDGKRYKVML